VRCCNFKKSYIFFSFKEISGASINSPELKTHIIALQVALPILPVFFLVAISSGFFNFDLIRQDIITLAWFTLWLAVLIGLVITTLFSEMCIDSTGLSFRTLWIRLLGFKGYPVNFSFDEMELRSKWKGRLLVIGKGGKLTNLLLYNFWVMPFKWRESGEIVKLFKADNKLVCATKNRLKK
jgi:hypothetical protein